MKRKAILRIIIILLAIFIINTAWNYIIISKISNKRLKYKDCTNYSYKKLSYSTREDDVGIALEVYNKGAITKMSISNDVDVWYNAETKEAIFFDSDKHTAQETEMEFLIGAGLPVGVMELSFKDKILMSMGSIIFPKKVDNENCYCIIGMFGEKTYINKENGIAIKSMDGTTVKDGKKYKSIVEIRDFVIDKVTDEDVEKPDLTGYTIEEE